MIEMMSKPNFQIEVMGENISFRRKNEVPLFAKINSCIGFSVGISRPGLHFDDHKCIVIPGKNIHFIVFEIPVSLQYFIAFL